MTFGPVVSVDKPGHGIRRSLGRGFVELGSKPLHDYLVSPIGLSVPNAIRESGDPKRRKYGAVAITGGKGGTGKSTVSANLATLLGRAGWKVLLVDGDFGLANLHLLLGLQPKTSLARALTRSCDPSELTLPGPSGVRVIPGCSGVERMANLKDSQMRVLARTLADIEGDADVLLVDTAAGLSRQTLALLRATSRILLVTTPDIAAMTDAYALLKLLARSHPQAHFGLLVNRARSSSEAGEVAARLSSMSDRFLGRQLEDLGWIPEEASVTRWASKGIPIVLGDPQSEVSRTFKSVAERVLAFSWTVPTGTNNSASRYFDRLSEVLTASG